MSDWPFVSPGTRLVAVLLNATKWPSAEIAHPELSEFPGVEPPLTLSISVWLFSKFRQKTSRQAFVSPPTRLVASLRNATESPSAEIEGELLVSLLCAPPLLTLIRRVS